MTSARLLGTLFGTFGSLCSLCLIACGGDDADAVCDRRQECAAKSSDSFSVTECKQENQTSRERADTQGCASEYDDAASCAAGLDLQCADFTGDGFGRKLQAECGSTLKVYSRCSGDDDDTISDDATGNGDPNPSSGGSKPADELCDEQLDCAEKAGASFSVAECKADNEKARDEAESKGCKDQYAAAESCVAGVDYTCADYAGQGFADKASAQCSGVLAAYETCR